MTPAQYTAALLERDAEIERLRGALKDCESALTALVASFGLKPEDNETIQAAREALTTPVPESFGQATAIAGPVKTVDTER